MDGMGDRPLKELNNQTPLQSANTPNMDKMAREGITGIMDSIAPGIIPGSDTAHLSILGYNPYEVYTGRGPFEANGVGVDVLPGDIAFRCNFSTADNDLTVTDRRAGRIKEGTKEIVETLNTMELEDYPDMVGEGWTLMKVEEFANKYGLTLVVKDTKGNNISEYANYLDAIVIEQNRKGKIANGVSFSVKINIDMSSYNLVINYVEKATNVTLYDTKTEKKKNGESGNVTCPGKEGYTTEQSVFDYLIEGKDVTINCYYVKNNNSEVDE